MGSTSASNEDSPSGEPSSGDAPDRVLVGLVTRPHGLRGEVKIDVLSDVSDRFAAGGELLVATVADEQAAVRSKSVRRLRIASSRPIRGGAIVRFDDCETREQAEALRGKRLEVPSSEVPAAPDGLYYHFDLVGCRCVDADHGELGQVAAVVEDGGGALLEIKRGPSGSPRKAADEASPRGASATSTGRVLLVPFVEAFLESVDIVSKEIQLRLPPGLIETCESKS